MTEELYVPNRDDWRAWLRKNHESKREVWLVYYKKHTGKPSIPYDDSVEEALCFGWVDSIIRKIDAEKYARKFTPRTGKSRWSEANKKRVEKMIKEGKMIEAGLVSVKDAKECGQWFKASVPAKELAIPSYLKEALARNRRRWTILTGWRMATKDCIFAGSKAQRGKRHARDASPKR